jgi:hypothetical protein
VLTISHISTSFRLLVDIFNDMKVYCSYILVATTILLQDGTVDHTPYDISRAPTITLHDIFDGDVLRPRVWCGTSHQRLCVF